MVFLRRVLRQAPSNKAKPYMRFGESRGGAGAAFAREFIIY
jgi:hypothetical protein